MNLVFNDELRLEACVQNVAENFELFGKSQNVYVARLTF